MRWFIYPQKDATLYKILPNHNTGLDEILEISKTYYGGQLHDIARSLLQFNVTELSESISTGNIPADHQVFLNLKIADAKEIPIEYTLMVHAASQSWEMGVGTRFDDVTTNGVSWNYKIANDQTSSYWVPIPTSSIYASFAPGTTGSIDGRGGTWYTGSGFEVSKSFYYTGSDVRVNVTDIVQKWLSGSIENNGFILKHTTAFEDDNNDYGRLKFFGGDTNTIYPPTLEVTWDDTSWSTGSLTELTESGVVYFKNLAQEYLEGSRIKFRLGARDRYPTKTYSTSSDYVTIKHLPSGSSWYSLEDAVTGDVIIPFDSYSKLSCDSEGNFFVVWTDGLQSERVYKIKIKVSRSDGTIEYIDQNFKFKLSR